MRYVSLFSGIEAATVAWEPLGWEPVAFAEIEPYCCKLLAEKYPGVPNLGDVSAIDWRKFKDEYGTIDLLVGGSPCQSFSIAGTRTGLRGASGLMWEYVRAVCELRPRWVVWENVPGCLSSGPDKSTRGEDFGCLLRALDGCGYSIAWRILDAQFFNVAQRRERVLLVANSGAERAAAVLFDEEGLRGDFKTGRKKRQEITASIMASPDGVHGYTVKLRHTGSPNAGGGSGPLIQTEVSATLSTAQDQTLLHDGQACLTPWDGQAQRVYNPYAQDAAPTIQAAAAETGTPSKTIIQQVSFSRTARPKFAGDASTWVETGLANTLNCFDIGDGRTNELIAENRGGAK